MEDMNQKRFKNMYETLLYKIKEGEPEFSDYSCLLNFCNLCRSYNVDDFNQFRQNYRGANMSKNASKAVIEHYSKQYSHVPENERMAYITKMIYHNIIENGFGYHITSMNSYDRFKSHGIIPGDERSEMESILARLPKEKRYLMTAFASDYIDENGNPLHNFFYSTDVDLSRSYGKKPEWLRELGNNIGNEEFWREETKGLDGELVQELENLYEKYNQKYEKESGRLLVMFPLSKALPEKILEALKTCNAEQLMAWITSIPDGRTNTFVSKNEDGSFTETSHLDSSEMMFFDVTHKTLELGTETRIKEEKGGLNLQEIGQKTGRDVLRNQNQARQTSIKLEKDMTMTEEDKRKD